MKFLLVSFLRSTTRKAETDEELVRKYRNSNDSAYIGELFQRYTHLVFGVCMKYLKNEEDSKDAVMDLFEKILKELKRHEVESFKAWLYFVAKNYCLMKLRKERTLLSRADGYEKFVQEIVEYEGGIHLNNESNTEDLEQFLRMGISNLREEQQHCVTLYYFDQKSYKEIADESGYSMKQVKSFLQNAKRNLKIFLIHRYEH